VPSSSNNLRPVRISDDPVLAFGAVPGYGPLFNAGAVRHDGVIHLFARGVRNGYRVNPEPGPRFLDYYSDVVVFTSVDGRRFELQQVMLESSTDVYAYEDPRVQVVESNGEPHVVMTYTHLPPPDSGLPWRVGLHRLQHVNGRFEVVPGSGAVVGPEGVPDKDAVLFNLRDGRVAMIHRIHPDMQVAVFDDLDELVDPPDGYWEEHLSALDRHVIIRPTEGSLGVGAGAPPVRLDGELVLFFHEREANGHYTTRVALLDHDTGGVVAILPDEIMRPELPWEREGDVDNVVFVQGAIAGDDGHVYLTYGAADRCVGAAMVDGRAIVAELRSLTGADSRPQSVHSLG
jgi:predicted GH43/DUF377 family glycosyl hydrolase